MDLYINGLSCISPQPTFDTSVFPPVFRSHESNRLTCIEPDYTPFIDPKASRRMGRLLKYGTSAGLQALRDAAIASPDAISTGTGFGLLDDSGKFLRNVTEAEEGIVSPTAFIQSTHNTVSSNIALSVGCYGHNNTFVHKGFSFESALIDAQMLMGETPAMQNILAGAYDENTDYSFTIMQRLKLIRSRAVNNLELLSAPGSGTIAGEGAAFFLLSRSRTEHTYAKLLGTHILYKPRSAEKITSSIDSFLSRNGRKLSDIDIVISGLCGDIRRDALLQEVNNTYFSSQTILCYKHLCGEYMTSSAFALWLAAQISRTGNIPSETILKDAHRPASNILIYNVYKNDHAFILLSSEIS